MAKVNISMKEQTDIVNLDEEVDKICTSCYCPLMPSLFPAQGSMDNVTENKKE